MPRHAEPRTSAVLCEPTADTMVEEPTVSPPTSKGANIAACQFDEHGAHVCFHSIVPFPKVGAVSEEARRRSARLLDRLPDPPERLGQVQGLRVRLPVIEYHLFVLPADAGPVECLACLNSASAFRKQFVAVQATWFGERAQVFHDDPRSPQGPSSWAEVLAGGFHKRPIALCQRISRESGHVGNLTNTVPTCYITSACRSVGVFRLPRASQWLPKSSKERDWL